MRTDQNNNPAAITVDVARQAGLVASKEYVAGTPFPAPNQRLTTAKLLGDPVELTIKVIDAIGYYTHGGQPRWSYISIPGFVWRSLTDEQKRDVVGFHYQHEGGMEMRSLFPNYGKL